VQKNEENLQQVVDNNGVTLASNSLYR